MKRFLTLSSLWLMTIALSAPSPVSATERETFISDFHLNDPNSLNIERAKNLGFRIERIKKGSIYDRIGLKDGDIIKQVNHKAIKDSQQAKLVFHELKTSKKIDLIIIRDDREIPLHYDIVN